LIEARPSAGNRSLYPLVVGGEPIEADESFAAVDPSTGREWTRVAQATTAEVDAAVTAARRASSSWRHSGHAIRQRLLLDIADDIEARAAEWDVLLPTENGRPRREVANGDVAGAAGIFRYFAGLVRDQRGSTISTEDGHSHVYTLLEALGVVAALIPWNSPLITTAQKLAPALAAGNTMVLKPSEYASPSVIEFTLGLGAILPPGVVNVVTGDGPEVGAALTAHPEIAKISFTGGTATAKLILARAAPQLTPALMELGGKSSFIICDDADLDAAVQDALLGSFLANGEVCFASSRLLVHRRVYDEFVGRFVEGAARIRVGDALDLNTQLGPMITAAHRDRVLGHVDRGVDHGAKVLLGGKRLSLPDPLANGHFVPATILEDPDGVTPPARDEIFGPVALVERWSDEADVVARANATEYGLAAGLWTTNLARAHRLARQLEAGIIWVNKWFDTPPGAPIGGIKSSGFGRELSAETLREYSSTKTVNIGLSSERPELWG
jgi:aldehyde dehydrogenase